MGDRFAAVLLQVVRHQPVVRRPDQIVEEPPGPARDSSQFLPLFGVGWRVAVTRRKSGCPRDGRRHEPEHQDRQRNQEPARRIRSDHHSDCERHHRCDGHPLAHGSRERFDVGRSVRRHPLEQSSTADEQTCDRPADRVEHHPGLMEQEHCREQRLPRAGDDRVALCEDVRAQRHAADAARERASDLHVGGECQHENRQT
jgi:hypothetical protein